MTERADDRRVWWTWLATAVPTAGMGLVPIAGEVSAERFVSLAIAWLLVTPLVIGAVRSAMGKPAAVAVATRHSPAPEPPRPAAAARLRRPRRGPARRREHLAA